MWLHQACGLVQRSHQLQPPRPHNQQVGENTETILALITKLQLPQLCPVLAHVSSLQIRAGEGVEM